MARTTSKRKAGKKNTTFEVILRDEWVPAHAKRTSYVGSESGPESESPGALAWHRARRIQVQILASHQLFNASTRLSSIPPSRTEVPA